MSNCWVTVIPPESAADRLKEVYEQVKSPHGQVDHVYQAQSLRPETILGHDNLYKSVLHFENPACPSWFLEAVAVYTSYSNRVINGLGVRLGDEQIGFYGKEK